MSSRRRAIEDALPRVFMYWNLHKHCWSLRAVSGALRGTVVAHCSTVHLRNCEFKVSEAGRQRVLREKVKNVHAGVVGHLVSASGYLLLADTEFKAEIELPKEGESIRYNPYTNKTFVSGGSLEPVHTADWVIACGRKVVASPAPQISALA